MSGTRKMDERRMGKYLWFGGSGTTFSFLPCTRVFATLVISVDPSVPSELVAAGETFFATGEGALEGFLAGVSAYMASLGGGR